MSEKPKPKPPKLPYRDFEGDKMKSDAYYDNMRTNWDKEASDALMDAMANPLNKEKGDKATALRNRQAGAKSRFAADKAYQRSWIARHARAYALQQMKKKGK
jgi:hypothetical protein